MSIIFVTCFYVNGKFITQFFFYLSLNCFLQFCYCQILLIINTLTIYGSSFLKSDKWHAMIFQAVNIHQKHTAKLVYCGFQGTI